MAVSLLLNPLVEGVAPAAEPYGILADMAKLLRCGERPILAPPLILIKQCCTATHQRCCICSIVFEGVVAPGLQINRRDHCRRLTEMMVVPMGSFTVGSPANEVHRFSDERPQHKVTIAKPFAVGQFVCTKPS